MISFLIVTLFLSAFAGALVWAVRSHQAHEKDKRDRLLRSGFSAETNPTIHKKLSATWSDIETDIFYRHRHGYTLWYLEKTDSDGPNTPFLVVEFTDPAPVHPTKVWVLPAFAEEGGLGQKMFGLLATLAGHKNRLSVPFPAQSSWWAFAERASWLPQEPPSDFWRILAQAPPMSIKFQSEGLKIEIQPNPKTYKTPDPLGVLAPAFLKTAEEMADVFVHDRR